MTSTALPVFSIERESAEMIVLDIKVDGSPVTEYETQETAYTHYSSDSVRPDGDWLDPAVAGDVSGHLAQPAVEGMTTLWVRYAANPETPVRKVAHIRRV